MPVHQPTPQETPDTATAPILYAPGITRRSIILGFTLSVVHTCWMVYQELALLNIGEPTILTIVPTVIGIVFMLLAVLATAVGWRDVGSVHDLNQFPYFGSLAEGAWLGMFAVVMWNSRALLRQRENMLRYREKIPGEETEAISYRTALFGAGGGFLLLVLIGVLAGMRPSVALLAFSLYFIAIIVMARMYAQVALPLFCMAFFSFSAWTTTFTGTRASGDRESHADYLLLV